MTADKPKGTRRKLTKADKLAVKAERMNRDKARAAESERDYMDALKEAHEEARAQAASLPPLEVD